MCGYFVKNKLKSTEKKALLLFADVVALTRTTIPNGNFSWNQFLRKPLEITMYF